MTDVTQSVYYSMKEAGNKPRNMSNAPVSPIRKTRGFLKCMKLDNPILIYTLDIKLIMIIEYDNYTGTDLRGEAMKMITLPRKVLSRRFFVRTCTSL